MCNLTDTKTATYTPDKKLVKVVFSRNRDLCYGFMDLASANILCLTRPFTFDIIANWS